MWITHNPLTQKHWCVALFLTIFVASKHIGLAIEINYGTFSSDAISFVDVTEVDAPDGPSFATPTLWLNEETATLDFDPSSFFGDGTLETVISSKASNVAINTLHWQSGGVGNFSPTIKRSVQIEILELVGTPVTPIPLPALRYNQTIDSGIAVPWIESVVVDLRQELLALGYDDLYPTKIKMSIELSTSGWRTVTDATLSATSQEIDAPFRWTAGSGEFSMPRNWEGRLVPNEDSQVILDRDESYTIHLTGNANSGSVLTSKGAVSINLNGLAYEVGGRLQVSGTARLQVADGELRAGSVSIAGSPSNAALLTVTGANTLLDTGDIAVGGLGRGTLSVRDRAMLSANGLTTGSGDSPGIVTIEQRAQAYLSGDVVIDSVGQSQFNVLSGASIHARSFALSQSNTTAVHAVVSGELSELSTAEDFTLKHGSVLEISQGGHLEPGRDLRLEQGTTTISDQGSRVYVGRDVFVGRQDAAVFNVTSGGRVEARRDLIIGNTGPGVSEVIVRGDHSAIQIHGSLAIGGDITSGRLAVEDAGMLRVAGSSATAGRNGSLVGTDIEFGTWESGTDLINNGHVQLEGRRYKFDRWNANAQVNGNYFQGEEATLTLRLTDADRLSLNDVTAGMVVTGTANLAGTLEVQLSDGLSPEVGDRFAAILASEVRGRFSRFTSPSIGDDRFLALNYRTVTNGNPAQAALKVSPDSSDKVVEVIALEAPTGLTTSKSDLILIIHGTNSSKGAFEGVEGAIRSRIALDAANGLHRSVDVTTFDWSDFAGGSKDEFDNGHWLGVGGDPIQSANNGVNIGEALAKWTLDRSGYQRIHLLGHSSGAWLADSMADELKRLGHGAVQLTLWDAFVPSGVVRQGEGYLDESNLGDMATFAEQYFDKGGAGSLAFMTQTPLSRAVNIDLSALGGFRSPGESHSWPYEWYGETASGDSFPIGGFGFDKSFVNGPFPTHEGIQERGNYVTLSDANGPLSALVERLVEPMSFISADHIVTGNVTYDHNGALLTTNSPSMLTSIFDINSPASYISFDLDFYTAAEGLLSLYIGDQLIWELNSETLTGIEGIINSGWIDIPDLDAGRHSMILRVDNLTSEQVQVRVEDINFSTLVLAGDFTGDQVVDGADFLAWQRGSASPVDLEKWKSNFGARAATGSPSAAVPEPAASTLILLALVMLRFTKANRGF